ncbi:hypothetical protein E2C01_061880 [Portunus trituberculatus]|uniref:Uncharacterized protein n=1 Tax=Portunus trituberculatus TaxID=210409 RepID=A0A5B7H6G6_PORTR|nr:hypothetical protein [Portunus trituberculatus]
MGKELKRRHHQKYTGRGKKRYGDMEEEGGKREHCDHRCRAPQFLQLGVLSGALTFANQPRSSYADVTPHLNLCTLLSVFLPPRSSPHKLSSEFIH